MFEHDQLRLQNWRSKILQEAEVTGNVAKTCRRYGISRKTFYKWRQRFQKLGLAGLRDLSKGPHHSPRAPPPDIVEKILHLRRNYHLPIGLPVPGAFACICCPITIWSSRI